MLFLDKERIQTNDQILTERSPEPRKELHSLSLYRAVWPGSDEVAIRRATCLTGPLSLSLFVSLSLQLSQIQMIHRFCYEK